MNGEMDVFEAMGAPVYEPYDPFSGMTPSAIAGGPAKHLPLESYAPEPDFLTKMWQPVDYLWGTGEQFVEQTAEKLPALLWGLGAQKLRKVNEGAGVTVIHSQAPQPGGAPAQPTQAVLPGFQPRYPVAAPPSRGLEPTMVLIGAIIFALYIFAR